MSSMRARAGVELSIVIVSWNVREYLEQCLRSVYANATDLDFELYVVDNASNDGSLQMVKERFPLVHLIANDENIGFPKACNQAIRECEGKYVLLLNPDTVVLPTALQQMIQFMESQPRTGAVGPKIMGQDHTVQHVCARMFPTLSTMFFDQLMLAKLFPASRLFGSYMMGYWDHNSSREVDCLVGSCLMVRKSALDSIGLLDEQHFMYLEDIDLCYRLKQSGWKVYYLHTAEIIHYSNGAGQSTERAADITLFSVMDREAKMIFFERYYGHVHAVVLRGIFLLATICRLSLIIPVYLVTAISRHPARQYFCRTLWKHTRILQWCVTLSSQ